MDEQMIWHIHPFASPDLDGMAEVQGVSVDDDGGEQVKPRDPVILALRGAIADFALSAEVQGIFKRMMRLTLIELHLRTALHPGVEDPFDDKQRTLDPSRSCAVRRPSRSVAARW
jgi:hypothetical protein